MVEGEGKSGKQGKLLLVMTSGNVSAKPLSLAEKKYGEQKAFI